MTAAYSECWGWNWASFSPTRVTKCQVSLVPAACMIAGCRLGRAPSVLPASLPAAAATFCCDHCTQRMYRLLRAVYPTTSHSITKRNGFEIVPSAESSPVCSRVGGPLHSPGLQSRPQL